MKVLIVEDEEALRKVLQEKLERSGFETFAAKDGDEGWNLAKSKNPDIILLDLVLPKRSGFEVLTALKQDPELKEIPVFILSNLAEDESLKKALTMGAEDYFVKSQHPINEVVEKVKNRLLEKSR
jgi:two-component system alkaline phosphatase synthesis response regulator PhoP